MTTVTLEGQLSGAKNLKYTYVPQQVENFTFFGINLKCKKSLKLLLVIQIALHMCQNDSKIGNV